MSEVGWVAQALVNWTTGHVVDGHLRVELAIGRAEPTVPVAYVELTDEVERLVLATLDPLAAMANAEQDALAALGEGARQIVAWLGDSSAVSIERWQSLTGETAERINR